MWKSLRPLLTANLGSKIISVVLGLAVWLYVNWELHPLQKETALAEVKVVNVAGDLIPEVVPGELEVTISAEKEVMRRTRPYLRNLDAVVDATGKEAGLYDNIKPELMGLPPDINLARTTVSPPRVQLRLQRRTSKTLRLSWVESSPPPEGIEVGEPVIRPREVVVEGAEDELRLVAAAQVEVNLAGVEKGNIFGLPVHLYSAQGERIRNPGLSIEPSLVSVTVPIKGVHTKVVPVVPQVEKKGEGFDIAAIDVSPAVVTLSGQVGTLEQILHLSTETITVVGQQERESRRLRLRLPPGVRAIGGAEVQVTVTIRRLPAPAPQPPPAVEEGGGGGKTASPSDGD